MSHFFPRPLIKCQRDWIRIRCEDSIVESFIEKTVANAMGKIDFWTEGDDQAVVLCFVHHGLAGLAICACDLSLGLDNVICLALLDCSSFI